ncbi:hypothetical protein FHW88_005052 [Mucilaginibacter sp. SG538B]|nr:hypothetical protein [Mucilaginibacter sp. SG538B]
MSVITVMIAGRFSAKVSALIWRCIEASPSGITCKRD